MPMLMLEPPPQIMQDLCGQDSPGYAVHVRYNEANGTCSRSSA